MSIQAVVALLIVSATIVGIVRGWEVRLTLFASAVGLAALFGKPFSPLQTFFAELVNPTFVIPICCSLGFAQVVKACECDRHLVLLLLRPLCYVKPLLLPGVAAAAFAVNIPIVSQTGTVATVGPIALPLLLAAGVAPAVAGAVLFLGASVGGELLNPGGPEFSTVVASVEKTTGVEYTRTECVRRTLPYVLVQFVVSTIVFCWLRRKQKAPTAAQTPAAPVEWERPNLAMALVTLTPLVVLFLSSPPLEWMPIPHHWLATPAELATGPQAYNYRKIAFAMLVGVAATGVVAGAFGRRLAASRIGHEFFKGAGFAYAEVISLIVVAKCFADSLQTAGAGQLVEWCAENAGVFFVPMAVLGTAGFAMLSGSGIAATQGLFPLLAGGAVSLGYDAFSLGCLVVVASAAGRTASPVAAAGILSATLVHLDSKQITRPLFLPLLAGLCAATLLYSIR